MSQIPSPPPPPRPNPNLKSMSVNVGAITNNLGIIRLCALWLLYLINIFCGFYCLTRYLFLDFSASTIMAYQSALQSAASIIGVAGFVISLDIVVALLVYISRAQRK